MLYYRNCSEAVLSYPNEHWIQHATQEVHGRDGDRHRCCHWSSGDHSWSRKRLCLQLHNGLQLRRSVRPVRVQQLRLLQGQGALPEPSNPGLQVRLRSEEGRRIERSFHRHVRVVRAVLRTASGHGGLINKPPSHTRGG